MSMMDRLKETLANASVQALRDTSVIVQFRTSKPSPKVKSKRLTDEVHASHGAHDTGDVSTGIKLFPHGTFPEFQKCITHIRRAYVRHEQLSHAYEDKGTRVLFVTGADKYRGEIGIFKDDLKPLVHTMLAAIPAAMARVRASSQYLTGLYNEDDLQRAIARIQEPGAFTIEVSMMPLPDSNDLRVPGDWSNLVVDRGLDPMRAALVDSMVATIHEALEPVHKLRQEALNPDKKRWHQSLFDTPREKLAKVFAFGFLGEDDAMIRALRALDALLAGPQYSAKRMAMVAGMGKQFVADMDKLLVTINTELEEAGAEVFEPLMESVDKAKEVAQFLETHSLMPTPDEVHLKEEPFDDSPLTDDEPLVTDEEREALREALAREEEDDNGDPLARLTGLAIPRRQDRAISDRAQGAPAPACMEEPLPPGPDLIVVEPQIVPEEKPEPKPIAVVKSGTLADLMGMSRAQGDTVARMEEKEEKGHTAPSIDDIAAMSVDDLLRNLI